MSKIIAVAGGSGGLGRAIVEALKHDKRYNALILARKPNETLQKELGITVLQADYTDQDSLVQLLEKNKIDTVISTIAGYDQTPEVNLINAAERSTLTRRFIPSVWSGFDYTREQAAVNPMAAGRLQLTDALAPTSLEWTAIMPGVFLDFYALSIPSHVPKTAMALDIVGNAAGIPGTGTYPMPFTHSTDIGKYTVALLGLEEKWETKYFVAGDTKTWNEFVALAEAAKGVKFDVKYDSIEQLQKGEMTELPGHKAIYDSFGGEAAKPMFQKLFSQLAIWMAEGGIKTERPLLNEMFPGIETLTIEKALLEV